MRRSIATVSLSGTLPQKLQAIAAAGFDGIELFEPDFTHHRGPPAELAAMLQDLGLAVELFQPFRDFEAVPEAAFQRNLARAERKFDLMQAIGCRRMLVCSSVSPLTLPDPALAAAQLHALAERAARRGLQVGFEALSWGRHVTRWRQAWDIVRRADHPALGLILDSFHTLALGDDVDALVEQVPGDRISFLQMADAPQLSLNVIEWARHHRNFPGQGQLDVVGFYEQVVRTGYAGPLSLEIFNDVFRESPNRRIAVDAMRSLLWLESQVRGRLEASAPERAATLFAPERAATLFAPPPLPRFGGFAFVEFAVDAAAATALDALLRRMGFALRGRHRSKPVRLYQQGGIRLVVNTLGHALARERFERHGASVCALAVRADDAEAAQVRGVAMRSAPFEASLGPGEHRLPSLVSPGGTIVHFVPESLADGALYEADFEAVEDSAPVAPRGLGAIDHVGLALAPDRVDTWVLFCRAVLGLDAGESLQVADPFGLVRSFGMADAARRLRLVLIVSQSQRTRTARVVEAGGGVVVHHVAFACDDVLASVTALRAAGVGFAPISDNYYDDLETRFEFAPGEVDRLRVAGVLYDRTPQGSYLHAYTEPFAGRFFFELVQRVDGYDAYGAANAPARMASQSAEPGPEG
jgi:4-hydroxyphenylpyruvate dioxygenase